MSMKFTKDELHCNNKQKVFKDKYLNQISFPIGGIGTGCIGLSGLGSLKDFEIYGRPNIGSIVTKTFPLIRIKEGDKEPVCRVLQGPIQRPYTPLDGGAYHADAEGFPHMDSCEFRGEYPFANIDFKCKKMPVFIELEAYNPFIPSNPDASGIPCVILKYNITNNSDKDVKTSILWSLLNIAGYNNDNFHKIIFDRNFLPNGNYVNTFMEDDNVKGIIFENRKYLEDHPQFGSLALTTPNTSDDYEITHSCYWKSGPWFSSHYNTWDYFKEYGNVEDFKGRSAKRPDAGVISVSKNIKPGQSAQFIFYITWYFPNFVKYWQGGETHEFKGQPTWKNYYAKQFEDAFDVAVKLNSKEKDYYKLSKKFHDALFGTTMPSYVIDAVASNMSTLKSTTCFRLPDGTFTAWEGTHPDYGWCEGSCTHVWGYQQALPFLFPSLERSMHDANYKYNFIFDDIGAMEFRIQLPLGSSHRWTTPCADGQMGGIMHVYREWKLCGDNEWLRKNWAGVKLSLEFAWEDWDEDKTGVLREFQHNTYDIEFYGPNSMLTSYYLGALKAGSEMAEAMGDNKRAKEYLEVFEKGHKYVDEKLFDGEYYIQEDFDPKIAKLYQVGPGCLIDQILGQQIARIAGIDNFLEDDHIKSALKAIFKYNYKSDMREHENGARLYAVNNEAAIVLCTWPKGGRPELSFPYCDENMNGFEYAYATHCITEDLLDEGLTIIKSVRDRYDGWGRNPWDEFECGHHYARSMASYGALIALSGFEYDKINGYIGFTPKINKEEFSTFWSLDGVWGNYSQTESEAKLEILLGHLELQKIKIGDWSGKENCIIIFGKTEFNCKIGTKGIIEFPQPLNTIENDEVLFRLT